MGLFLSLSGVINKSEKDVAAALKSYLRKVGGDLEPAAVDKNHRNFCAIQTQNGNTTIIYPPYFFKWDECSVFLSKELHAAVFLLHIYDGDFWTYTLFFDGQIKDKFMPIPDYFNEDISDEEIDSWKGDANILTNYVPGLLPGSIEKYLINWDLDQEEVKAYEDDEFTNCEYQLFDFMKKIKLPYQVDNSDNPKGEAYLFWSNDFPLETFETNPIITSNPLRDIPKQKAWWKFW
jgi:hypothetical protein